MVSAAPARPLVPLIMSNGSSDPSCKRGGWLKHDAPACTVRRVSAAEMEDAVIDQVRGLLRSPEMIVRTWRAGQKLIAGLTESEVREALQRLDPLWDELFPAEQARVVQLLVERVDVGRDAVDIRLRTEGLTNLTAELGAVTPER